MVTTAMRRALAAAVAGLFLIAAAALASAQDVKPELSRVRLAVRGKPALFYLPLTVTERLGYFREAGLDKEISGLALLPRVLKALICWDVGAGLPPFKAT